MRTNKLPVTVLSGFLGAGKTTLLNEVLHNKESARLVENQNTLSRPATARILSIAPARLYLNSASHC